MGMDIVDRLREYEPYECLYTEAADTIQQQAERIAELEKELKDTEADNAALAFHGADLQTQLNEMVGYAKELREALDGCDVWCSVALHKEFVAQKVKASLALPLPKAMQP
jgi:light-regulated signal transduction histidine kinase (bacteriophytochrome)